MREIKIRLNVQLKKSERSGKRKAKKKNKRRNGSEEEKCMKKIMISLVSPFDDMHERI